MGYSVQCKIEELIGKTLTTIIIITIIILTLVAIYFGTKEISSRQYKRGYEQGTWHTVLHLQATGYLPSMEWRTHHLYDDIQTPEQLLKLSPEITFINKDPCIKMDYVHD